MRHVLAILFMVICSLSRASDDGFQERLTSPDGRVAITLQQRMAAAGAHALYYDVRYEGEVVIRESLLELRLDNHLSENAMALPVDRHARWFSNLKKTGVRRDAHDSTWKPVTGERAFVRDHYQSLAVDLVKDDNPIYQVSVELRAYNEGVAIRFVFPENPKGTYYRVVGEDTEFAMPAGTKAWFHGWAQAPYRLMPCLLYTSPSPRD